MFGIRAMPTVSAVLPGEQQLIPIRDVVYKNDMWWSIPADLSPIFIEGLL